MDPRCHVELFRDGAWHRVAWIRREQPGERRQHATTLEYEHDYILGHIDELDRVDFPAVSTRFPLNFVPHNLPGFPAFTIDLIPQGEALRVLEAALKKRGEPVTDWRLLLSGAHSPVGNLRITESVQRDIPESPGVDRAEVIQRGDRFREWAEAQGIPMTGSSDTLGAAPKLLLAVDARGLFHADGALPDAQAVRHYLVKYPRGLHSTDTTVLANEAPYLEVVRALGLRCGAPLTYTDSTLFVPRFDRRRVSGRVERLGMESLYALLGEVEPGAAVELGRAAMALAKVVDDPHADVLEFVCRDAAALAMGNTDNHGRNTSVLKPPEGGIVLSPVYDFAPMFHDRGVIKRTLTWRSEPPGEPPDWEDVCQQLSPILPGDILRPHLRALGERIAALPELMADCGVDERLITLRRGWIARVAAGLCAVKGG